MSIVFDRAVGFYDQTRGFPPDAEHLIAEALRNQTDLRAGSRVLEIGIGTGRIALPLVRFNRYRYAGADLSVAMMRVLQRKAGSLPILLTRADVARLPFADATFDAVVAVHIFHLIDDWQGAMAEAQRVLRPGGLLLHGKDWHDDRSTIFEMRRAISDAADANEHRRRAGLIAWREIGPELERRFGPATRFVTPHWTISSTPATLIKQLRARTWSHTWDLSDQQIDAAAEQARAWAIERFGSLDTRLTSDQRFRWERYTKDA